MKRPTGWFEPVDASTGAAKPSSAATMASTGAFCSTASAALSTATPNRKAKPTLAGSRPLSFMAASVVR
ncbi:hypothetical protein D9M68_973290 [compost metagenome]